MACTCTEDKFFVLDNGIRGGKFDASLYREEPWDGVKKGTIIGRNRVMCQECIDRNIAFEREEKIREKANAITALELKNLRKLFDGEDLTEVNAERLKLRNEIRAL